MTDIHAADTATKRRARLLTQRAQLIKHIAHSEPGLIIQIEAIDHSLRALSKNDHPMVIYDDNRFSSILASFTVRSNFTDADKKKFRDSLEGCAWIYREGDAVSKSRPSDQRRDLKSLSNNVKHLSEAIVAATHDIYLSTRLRDAGLIQHLKHLAALKGIIDKVERKVAVRKPGNRPNEPLHEFVRSIDELYRAAAAKPRRPDGRATERDSELLNLLQACLKPLGVSMGYDALRKTYYRASE